MTVNFFEGGTNPWPKRNARPFPLTKNGNSHDDAKNRPIVKVRQTSLTTTTTRE